MMSHKHYAIRHFVLHVQFDNKFYPLNILCQINVLYMYLQLQHDITMFLNFGTFSASMFVYKRLLKECNCSLFASHCRSIGDAFASMEIFAVE